jgi:hypothetical protein
MKWSIVLIAFVLLNCQDKSWNSKIGIEFSEPLRIYQFENFYGSKGEGYLVEIYQINEDDFKKINVDKISNFPVEDEYKVNWKIKKWDYVKNTESIDNIKKIINSNFKKGIDQNRLDSFNKNLSKFDNLICYYYKGDMLNPHSVSLYLINPQEKRVYFFDFVQ